MEFVDEKILLNYIREYIKNGENENDYLFSIYNTDWKRMIDCHLRLFDDESLMLAARWANDAEKAIAENDFVDYCDFSKVILKSLDKIKAHSDVFVIMQAYQLLVSLDWTYRETIVFPLNIVEDKINSFGELQAPYVSVI